MRAIVRLSGPFSLHVADSMFITDSGASSSPRSFSAAPGLFRLPEECLNVPAVRYTMRAPRSYTREDVVEMHVPGSPAVVDMVLDALLKSFPKNLRLARPGEFTRRAFINGRIDLAQAEAVMSVITARNKAELTAANARLAGNASDLAKAAENELFELLATIEAALDFDVQGIETMPEKDFLNRCRSLRERLSAESKKSRGELTGSDRLNVTMCGPPNAGKSSILNRLSGRKSAMVHKKAGTTRDPVSEYVEINGISFAVTDTAGVECPEPGPASDVKRSGGECEDIDALAAKRARDALESAQLVILVFDAGRPLPEGWKNIVAHIDRERTLCVFNKIDLPLEADPTPFSGKVRSTIYVSALKEEGIVRLKDAIERVVIEGGLDASPADRLFNARQREAIRQAVAHMKEAEQAVAEGLSYEFAAVCLREASDALAQVTGDTGNMEILDHIFSRFCIGK